MEFIQLKKEWSLAICYNVDGEFKKMMHALVHLSIVGFL